MADYAKFTAEILKDFKTGDNVEFKLRIPLKQALPHLIFLAQHQGKEVNVVLGDPQMAMNFSDEEEEAMYQKFTGRYVTTDASGVVTKVEEKEEDENQVELFDENGQPVQALEEQEHGEGERSEVTDQQDGEGTGTEGEGTGLDDDLPDWMKDGSGPEMNFTDDGQGDTALTPEDQDPPAGKTEPGQDEGQQEGTIVTGEITKEQIEEYILQQKPIFPDIDLDFPVLVEKRRNGSTWLSLSKELGIPSSQLNTKFKKYKDKVKDLMQGAGVA